MLMHIFLVKQGERVSMLWMERNHGPLVKRRSTWVFPSIVWTLEQY